MTVSSRWTTPARLATVAAGIVVAALSLIVTAGYINRLRAPDVSLTLPVTNGFAYASAAQREFAQQSSDPLSQLSPQVSEKAIRYSLAGYSKEPLDSRAIRNLALDAHARGEDDSARALMNRAEQYSRRDLFSNLWLMLHDSNGADTKRPQMLLDRALRVSRPARLPVLSAMVARLEDPAVHTMMTELLLEDPAWTLSFYQAARLNRAVAADVAKLTLLVATPRDQLPEAYEVDLIRNLVSNGQFAEAIALYNHWTNQPSYATVRSPGFVGNGDLPPLDWQTSSTGATAVLIRPQGGGLEVDTSHRNRVTLARQVVLLQNAEHALDAKLKAPSANPPQIVLSCATDRRASASTFDFDREGVVRKEFRPRSNCRFHWLEVIWTPTPSNPTYQGIVESVSISRR